MKLLRELDEVAYVRFASVYRSFRDIDEFRSELDKMALARAAPGRPDERQAIGAAHRAGRARRTSSTSRATRSGWALALEKGARGDALAQPARRRGGRQGRRDRRRRDTTSARARITPRSSRCARPGRARRAATLYVTLEPCNHVGRTPPCTDAIVAARRRARRRRCRDPNPHVLGRRRREAARGRGRRSTSGAARPRRARLIAPWTKFVTTGMPYVTLKLGPLARRAHRDAHGRVEVGHRARRRARAFTCCAPSTTPSSSASAPRSPTTRASPCATRPARARSASSSTRSCACRSPAASCRSAREVPTWVVCTTDAPSSRRGASSSSAASRCCAPRRRPRGASTPSRRCGCSAPGGSWPSMIEGGAELAGSVLAGHGRRRAARLHRPDPARPARAPGRRRLGGPGHARRGPVHRGSPVGGVRGRRPRLGLPPVPSLVPLEVARRPPREPEPRARLTAAQDSGSALARGLD